VAAGYGNEALTLERRLSLMQMTRACRDGGAEYFSKSGGKMTLFPELSWCPCVSLWVYHSGPPCTVLPLQSCMLVSPTCRGQIHKWTDVRVIHTAGKCFDEKCRPRMKGDTKN